MTSLVRTSHNTEAGVDPEAGRRGVDQKLLRIPKYPQHGTLRTPHMEPIILKMGENFHETTMLHLK